jgi:hypothetical protein
MPLERRHSSMSLTRFFRLLTRRVVPMQYETIESIRANKHTHQIRVIGRLCVDTLLTNTTKDTKKGVLRIVDKYYLFCSAYFSHSLIVSKR